MPQDRSQRIFIQLDTRAVPERGHWCTGLELNYSRPRLMVSVLFVGLTHQLERLEPRKVTLGSQPARNRCFGG